MRRFDKKWLLSACSSGGRNPGLLFKAALARSQQGRPPAAVPHWAHASSSRREWVPKAGAARGWGAVELGLCRVQGPAWPPTTPWVWADSRPRPPAPARGERMCEQMCARLRGCRGPEPPQAEHKPSPAKVAAENALGRPCQGRGASA